jgi:hypothetical protein
MADLPGGASGLPRDCGGKNAHWLAALPGSLRAELVGPERYYGPHVNRVYPRAAIASPCKSVGKGPLKNWTSG